MKDFLDYMLLQLRTALDEALTFVWRLLINNLRRAWHNIWVKCAVSGVLAIAMIFVVYWGCAIFDVGGFNTYEEGWQAGNLADYTGSNRLLSASPIPPPGWLFPTGEGDILLGDASSRNAVLDGKTISPAYFSTSWDTYLQNRDLVTQQVAIHYRKLIRRWNLNGETDIHVSAFEKLTAAEIPPHCSYVSNDWLGKNIGYQGGKIVRVYTAGDPLYWKTYEAIIYRGGNEFHDISIVDTKMFECAILALKTGFTMKIAYDNRAIRNPFTQRTTFNLIALERGQ